MLRIRFPILALVTVIAMPALAQIASSTSPIPNGMSPVVPTTPQVGVSPPLNTATPVGSVGIGGTTTQVMPNYANPSGGVSLPGSTSSGLSLPSTSPYSVPSATTGIILPGTTSATASSVPGYTPPGSTNLPGYSAPPGTVAFPGMSTSPSATGSSGTLGVGGSSGVIRTTP